MTPRVQQRVDAFYEWEARGRGRLLWERPVRVEPPFVPFNRDTSFSEPIDDGQIETFGSKLSHWLTRPLGQQTNSVAGDKTEKPAQDEEEFPEPDDTSDSVVEISVALPQSSTVSCELAEQFLLSLQQCRYPISFEVVGRPDRVIIQFA
ncbi:MAG TPA: hypothetical protein EYQ50_06395 [Verrucomicrobiales bacterium]|nr:hypothetical protein [Verrucomicrobiales bacterium]